MKYFQFLGKITIHSVVPYVPQSEFYMIVIRQIHEEKWWGIINNRRLGSLLQSRHLAFFLHLSGRPFNLNGYCSIAKLYKEWEYRESVLRIVMYQLFS